MVLVSTVPNIYYHPDSLTWSEDLFSTAAGSAIYSTISKMSQDQDTNEEISTLSVGPFSRLGIRDRACTSARNRRHLRRARLITSMSIEPAFHPFPRLPTELKLEILSYLLISSEVHGIKINVAGILKYLAPEEKSTANTTSQSISDDDVELGTPTSFNPASNMQRTKPSISRCFNYITINKALYPELLTYFLTGNEFQIGTGIEFMDFRPLEKIIVKQYPALQQIRKLNLIVDGRDNGSCSVQGISTSQSEQSQNIARLYGGEDLFLRLHRFSAEQIERTFERLGLNAPSNNSENSPHLRTPYFDQSRP